MALTEEERATIRARREADRERYRPGKLSEEQRREMVHRYCEGERIGELARRFGVRRQTVSYHLDKALV